MAGFLGMVLLTVVMAGGWTLLLRHNLRIARHWIHAVGIVESHGVDRTADPTRSIRLGTGSAQGTLSELGLNEGAFPSEFPVGSAITVRFDPRNPTRCALPPARGAWIGLLLFSIVIYGAMIFFWIVWFFAR